jgi:hypothetical protein
MYLLYIIIIITTWCFPLPKRTLQFAAHMDNPFVIEKVFLYKNLITNLNIRSFFENICDITYIYR